MIDSINKSVNIIKNCIIYGAVILLWCIGELGTLGAGVPNNGGYASFHAWFLIPWAASGLIIYFWEK